VTKNERIFDDILPDPTVLEIMHVTSADTHRGDLHEYVVRSERWKRPLLHAQLVSGRQNRHAHRHGKGSLRGHRCRHV
jgi:hypothetical protein